jgi:hypothetical protein
MTNNINLLNIKKQNLEKIKFSGILFQGVNTRLKADYSFNSSGNSYDNYYDIQYQIKVNNIYCELFSARHRVGKNQYTILLLSKRDSGEKISLREEELITSLKKQKINAKYFANSYTYYAINPIQFCSIPFLEDEVKDWLMFSAQQTYSHKDFRDLALSIMR